MHHVFRMATACAALMTAAQEGSAVDYFVYFGTYTGPMSKGIYVSSFDPETGKLSAPELALEATNPSYLAVHPNTRVIYAVAEASGGAVLGARIDRQTGKLTLLNQQPSGGDGPCHVAVDSTGKCVGVANYGSGSVSLYGIDAQEMLQSAGSIIQQQGSGPNVARQKGPHAHQVTFTPDNKHVLVCDLGADKVFAYTLDLAKATLTPATNLTFVSRPGAGPRHLAFRPDGKFLYVINELDSTIMTVAVQKDGSFKTVQTVSTLPKDLAPNNSCAEVVVHPNGNFVYGSNRGHDSIAVFASDSDSGLLKLVEHTPSGGNVPRFIGLDPTGRWMFSLHQKSNSIVVFEVDASTGRLKPTGTSYELGSPVCAVFVPKGTP